MNAQVISDSFGLFVWPSAIVLARHLWRRRAEVLRGTVVLELGAGCGLCGMLAAHPSVNASRVVLTDRAESELVLSNAQEAIGLNGLDTAQGGVATVMGLTWGRVTQPMLSLPAIDVIIGSDCLYHEPEFEALLATVVYLLRHRPPSKGGQGVFITTYHDRGVEGLPALLRRWGLQADLWLEDAEDEQGEEEDGAVTDGEQSIHVLYITLDAHGGSDM